MDCLRSRLRLSFISGWRYMAAITKRQQIGAVRRINGDKHSVALVFIDGNGLLRGSNFWRVGQMPQKMLKISIEHDSDDCTQVVPVLLARTELGAAVLIPTVTQLQNLMDVKGQQVQDKKVVG